jgi:hypothetical protein
MPRISRQFEAGAGIVVVRWSENLGRRGGAANERRITTAGSEGKWRAVQVARTRNGI